MNKHYYYYSHVIEGWRKKRMTKFICLHHIFYMFMLTKDTRNKCVFCRGRPASPTLKEAPIEAAAPLAQDLPLTACSYGQVGNPYVIHGRHVSASPGPLYPWLHAATLSLDCNFAQGSVTFPPFLLIFYFLFY